MHYSTPNYYDILVDQGATLNRALFLKNSVKGAINLDGYLGRMHIRDSKNSSVIVRTLTSNTSEITIDESAGRVDILLTPSSTEALEAKKYVYDLELESPEGEVTKILSGQLIVRVEITY